MNYLSAQAVDVVESLGTSIAPQSAPLEAARGSQARSSRLSASYLGCTCSALELVFGLGLSTEQTIGTRAAGDSSVAADIASTRDAIATQRKTLLSVSTNGTYDYSHKKDL